MPDKINLDSQIEIIRGLGFKSRTFLNGITGPVQIIRSLSDDPNLIDPLRMLELSVSRFDKFSFRALVLADLLGGRRAISKKTFDLVDLFKYMVLDLTDYSDFFDLKVEVVNTVSPIEINNDVDVLSHCILILLENIITLSTARTEIKIEIRKVETTTDVVISCVDNGFVAKALTTYFNSNESPSDIELYLLKTSSELLGFNLDIQLTTNNQTTVKMIFT